MTNKLLATVMTVAVSGALTAHAAQGVKVEVPSTATAAPHIAVLATPTPAAPVRLTTPAPTCPPATVAASIRQAYQRDYAALEQLKQLGSSLKGAARVQFTNVIATDEAAGLNLQNSALAAVAACRPLDQNGTIAQMDNLVTQARAAYDTAKHEADAVENSGKGESGGD